MLQLFSMTSGVKMDFCVEVLAIFYIGEHCLGSFDTVKAPIQRHVAGLSVYVDRSGPPPCALPRNLSPQLSKHLFVPLN